MKHKLTFLYSLMIVISTFSFLEAQNAKQEGDSQAPYLVNPNPISGEQVLLNPLEEVFGSNDVILGAADMRGRGNIFQCDSARKLIEHGLYMNPMSTANMWFLVYEGDTFLNGVFNLVNAVNHPAEGPGEGWYKSGQIDYDLQPGKFYMIYVQWDVNSFYYNEQNVTPYPVPCSFGFQYSGYGWNCGPIYGDPPPQSQTNCETENEGVSYYQTIVTDEIPTPVELLSFTYQKSNDDVTLNWVTATETNNQGFEVQRSTGSEFCTIGFISGNGTTTENHRYAYTDQNLVPGKYAYRLKQVDLDGSSHYYDQLNVEISSPLQFALEQNYPNPFNPSTKIKFSVPNSDLVKLIVFDVLGNEVAVLVNEVRPEGNYEIDFNAASVKGGLPSGIYFSRLQAGNFVQTKKMMLMK